MLLINESRITLFPSRGPADALAAANAADDADFEYRVVENAAGKFLVQIYDEDGAFVGTL